MVQPSFACGNKKNSEFHVHSLEPLKNQHQSQNSQWSIIQAVEKGYWCRMLVKCFFAGEQHSGASQAIKEQEGYWVKVGFPVWNLMGKLSQTFQGCLVDQGGTLKKSQLTILNKEATIITLLILTCVCNMLQRLQTELVTKTQWRLHHHTDCTAKLPTMTAHSQRINYFWEGHTYTKNGTHDPGHCCFNNEWAFDVLFCLGYGHTPKSWKCFKFDFFPNHSWYGMWPVLRAVVIILLL